MDKEIERRPNAVIVLEILLAGFPIQFKDDEHTYYYQDGMFWVDATKTDTNRPGWCEQVLLGVDLSLADFIKACGKFSFEEMFAKSCELALTKSKQKVRT